MEETGETAKSLAYCLDNSFDGQMGQNDTGFPPRITRIYTTLGDGWYHWWRNHLQWPIE